jgi:CBS domain-containing protein
VPGKADWSASGFPIEGTLADVTTIGKAARRDIPTCSPAEKVGAARERARKAGQDRCVVVNEERVVLGLLREKELERVMNLGKSRIEMRISRSAWFPRDLCFLHS